MRAIIASRRLVTLTGVGGVGKTRLALRVAAELTRKLDSRVWFVELAVLSDPSLVAQAVATVLEVREQPAESLTDTVIKGVGDRELLLILDNCEHLVLACAELCEAMLSSCPRVRVLTSSREPRWPSMGLNSRKPETRRRNRLTVTPMAPATSAMAASPCGRNSCNGGSSRRMVTGSPAMISNSASKSLR